MGAASALRARSGPATATASFVSTVVPATIESIIADRDLLDRLFARLRELDPDADTIITMWIDDDNVSDRAIAKALGRPQRTFADQMKKYRTELRRIRGY